MNPNHPAADDERPGRPPEPVTAVINGDQVMFLDCPALAGAQYRTGQDQPPNPAHDAQPERSRTRPYIANPAPASASKEDTS